MFRNVQIAVSFIVLIMSLVVAPFARAVDPIPPAKAADGSNLTVLYSGNRQGEFEPCGCRDKNAGGIDREAKFIADLRASGATVHAFDVGGLVYSGTAANVNEVAIDHYYRILAEIDYTAINVGFAAFKLGVDKLKDLARNAKAPLVSANIVDGDGNPVFPTYRKFTVKDAKGDDIVIGVTGVTAQKYMWSGDVLTARGLKPAPQPTPVIRAAPVIKATPVSQPASVTPKPAPRRAPIVPVIPGYRPGETTPKPNAETSYSNTPADDRLRQAHATLDAFKAEVASGPVAFAQAATAPQTATDAAPVAAPSPAIIAPHRERLGVVLEEMRKECDMTIVLFDGGKYEARELAREFGPDLVLTDEATPPAPSPEKIGRTLLNYCGNRGKVLGRLDLAGAKGAPLQVAKAYKYDILNTSPAIDEISAMVARWKTESARARAQRTATTADGAASGDYTGYQFCMACHLDQYKQWVKTPHAIAYEALKKADKQSDPKALARATTGYGKFGGFTTEGISAHLKHVQCEACHGAGRRHKDEQSRIKFYKRLMTQFPDKEFDVTPKVKMRAEFDEAFCAGCHAEAPGFDFKTAIEKVSHPSKAPGEK